MGNWKRRERNAHFRKKRQKNPSGVRHDIKDLLPTPWGSREQKDLLWYLTQYREGCKRFYHGEIAATVAYEKSKGGKDGSLNTAATIKKIQEIGMGTSTDRDSHILIGDVAFPEVTDKILSQPFLVLPKTLSPKQRKAVHEACIEAELCHCAVGKTRLDRVLIVSIYSDVFDHLENIQKPTQSVPMHKYRPWYYRRQAPATLALGDIVEKNPRLANLTVQKVVERKALFAIEALLDQPGECLRDGIDELDLEGLTKGTLEDLSDIEPPGSSDTDRDQFLLVDSVEKMNQCITELLTLHKQSALTELAFDVEAYNLSKFAQLTCLLQLTTNAGKEYVLDVLAPGVWDLVCELAPIFADPAIVKIGHSIGSLDVRSLHRDFGLFVVNAFDTYEAARILRLPAHGLAAVCQSYGLRDSAAYLTLKRDYQACDWRMRPLSPPMVQYGRYDIHYLIRLRKLMIRDLTHGGLWHQGQDGAKVLTAMEQENEAKRVAEALAETLKQFDDEENAEELNDESGFGTSSTDRNGSFLDDDNEHDDEIGSGSDDHDHHENTDSLNRSNDDSGDCDEDEFRLTRDGGRSSPDAFVNSSQNENQIVQQKDRDPSNLHDGARDENPTKADASMLRMQPRLMKVISLSQERCKDIWSSKTEPHYKNGMFVSFCHRGRLNQVEWTAANKELYEDLVKWRANVAKEMECLPGFVASLDFLAAVALKRPVSIAGLRRLSYVLPHVLEEIPSYQEDLLEVVRESLRAQNMDPSLHETVYRFSDRRKGNTTRREPESLQSPWWTVVLVVGIGAGVAFTVFAHLNRRKKR